MFRSLFHSRFKFVPFVSLIDKSLKVLLLVKCHPLVFSLGTLVLVELVTHSLVLGRLHYPIFT